MRYVFFPRNLRLHTMAGIGFYWRQTSGFDRGRLRCFGNLGSQSPVGDGPPQFCGAHETDCLAVACPDSGIPRPTGPGWTGFEASIHRRPHVQLLLVACTCAGIDADPHRGIRLQPSCCLFEAVLRDISRDCLRDLIPVVQLPRNTIQTGHSRLFFESKAMQTYHANIHCVAWRSLASDRCRREPIAKSIVG